jgi:hypothetical protein
MSAQGWEVLVDGWPWFKGDGKYPIAAYSEFMPPPRLVRKPYGCKDMLPVSNDDPWGWPVTEYEEYLTIRPGMEHIAHQLVHTFGCLGCGDPAHGISKAKLIDNIYWPRTLAARAGKLTHERYVTILALALSLTQDDKGRVRWTLFGSSEQGPARAFWKSFFKDPKQELPPEDGLAFLRRLLATAYGEHTDQLEDLGRAGFRILPINDGQHRKLENIPGEGTLPTWTKPLLLTEEQSLRGVKYLLTFRPFIRLPAAVQRAYLDGRLHLLPFPGSMVFWGAPNYWQLDRELPMALQIPLLHAVSRHEALGGIRIPQSGWLHEPRPDRPVPNDHFGPIRNTYRRTHRWERIHRHEDELAVDAREDKLMHVLFSTALDDLGLYGKPMARNAQIWDHEHRVLLDGPRAGRDELRRAMHLLHQGGLFGYRMQFPPMQVGPYALYWHRPLVAFLNPRTDKAEVVHNEVPTGYLTTHNVKRPRPARPVELWPRLLSRTIPSTAVRLYLHLQEHPRHTLLNIRKLHETWHALGEKRLPRSFARQLLTLSKEESLEAWLESLPSRASDVGRGHWLAEELKGILESPAPASSHRSSKREAEPLTYAETSRRSFEVAYWKSIAYLSEGKYLNKNNADCVRDPATQGLLKHHRRDLEALGDYLLSYYENLIDSTEMAGRAIAGELPFSWQTDFEFNHFGGWLGNQEGETHERNLIVIIPGRDRRRAVIMADHYDTAYMEDRFESDRAPRGARIAAAGADDNYSATAALMHGAPIFLRLSKEGGLDCDIWLIHLTGEEFPADCLGARHLCQGLVEGTLKIRYGKNRVKDLSKTEIQGVYVLDMVAHNRDHDRDVFQVAPGANKESLWLAYQAHVANETWNRLTHEWNRRPARRGCERGQRSSDGSKIPRIALHPVLSGEVRPHYAPRSTIYNTDGQIFSDAGIPVVLFMENYDINRCGYHDSHDTMANIDLDYGAAVTAIAIESVARAATTKPDF